MSPRKIIEHGSTCDMQLSNTQSLRACAHIMSDNDSKNISTKMSNKGDNIINIVLKAISLKDVNLLEIRAFITPKTQQS